jgi:hypothetical protein
MSKAWISGAKDVLEWFDTASETPFFSLWMGKQLVFSWNKDDETQGRSVLAENLESFEKGNVSDIFTIKLHPKLDNSGFISDKTPIYGSLNFRPANTYQMQVSGVNNENAAFPNNPAMQRMFDKLSAIDDRLNAVESEEEEEEQTALAGIMANPLIQLLKDPIFAPMLSGIAKQIFPGIVLPSVGSIGNVPDNSDNQDQKIQDALKILMQHDTNLGDDLAILAKIAEKDPKQFEQFLMILRTNG